ncbi:MAG: phosphoesterase, partial [Candidatus Bathyarchaeota archaeon]|nr:phosphoesterase [Candidatus Bathyarchaeota archaeon]
MPIKPIQPYPALLLRRKTERVLVVADLHIGWEAPLTQKGVHVPSQTPKILDKILQLIKTCK